ncbi:MAG: FkbM family methyltransferase [Flavobacteriales bacterium]|nr:FkbM family methyltransferase [Flavobacteriales bacterium]
MREYAYFKGSGWKTRTFNLFRRTFKWGPLERLLQKQVQGKPPGKGWAKLVPAEYLYAPGSWRTVVRGKHEMRLDLSNTTDHWACFAMSEPAHSAFEKHLKLGCTVVDIGANIGVQTLAYSAIAGIGGRVISLEPHPETFKRLEHHLQINGITNVTALNVGIGQEESVVTMYEVVASNSGMNRIIPTMDTPNLFPHTEVRITPLGTILHGLGVEHVDAIKIDVEGFEMEVLKGCRSTLLKDMPTLLVEVDDDNLRENRSSAKELATFLASLDYTIRMAHDGAAIPGNLEHTHFDILCTNAGIKQEHAS